MPVDKTELAKDLATPEYQAIVKDELSKKEFVIRTKDEETTFQTNFKKDVIEREIGPKIAEVHSQYDKDVEELYGIKRNQDEKSYDFNKRAAKAKLAEYDAAKTEVASLKEQIKGGDPTGTLKKQLEESEERARVALADKDKRITELEGLNTITKKESQLLREYGDIKATFKKELPTLFDVSEKAVLDEALRNSVLKDGKLYATNSDGSIKKDASFKEILVKEELAVRFKDVVDVTKVQGGSGSSGSGKNKDGGIDPKTITDENFVMPEGLKSRDALMTHLIELGVPRGTEQFTKIWNKFGKDLPAM